VLLVDDTESVLLLYARQLRASGYEVLLAESGAAALVILERETPDLIVLDCMMPNMSGLEVLRKVRQMPLLADIPVIFLTAAGDEEELVNRAFEQGISDYIAKPVNRHVLVARINALIAERRSRSVEQRLDATSLASHKDLVEEVARAQSLQRAQLPQVPMRWSNWFVTGLLVPCSQVGGDLFDVVEGPGYSRVAVLIDVSGHGVASAMVASAVRAILRLLIRSLPFGEILAELNRQILASGEDHYACVGLVQLGSDEVRVANAGLPPIVVISGGEVLAEITGSGSPPGLIDGAEYDHRRFAVKSGQRIVLASDGLTEPFGGADCIAPYLNGLGLLSSAEGNDQLHLELGERLQKTLSACDAKQDDDATVLVLDCLGLALPFSETRAPRSA